MEKNRYCLPVIKNTDASRLTIIKNGGQLENEVKDDVGLGECGIIQRYWIIL
jgi:predicted acetyltransferase